MKGYSVLPNPKLDKTSVDVLAVHDLFYPMKRLSFQWDGLQIIPIFHYSCIPLFHYIKIPYQEYVINER